jgi:DNA polymerase-3 subunit delta'
MAQRKVLLCSPLEAMTIAAFNAFLKCLEEPQGATVIILVLAQGQSIPATIRSRCQRYPLPMPSTAASRGWLRAALAAHTDDIDAAGQDATVDEYLRMAEDRPMLALRLLRDPQGAHAQFATLIEGSKTGRTPDWLALERAGAALDGQELLDQLERAVQSWLRMQDVSTLRSARGRRGFDALAEYAHWRNACRAGSNPSPELLRFRALRLYRGLWESSPQC